MGEQGKPATPPAEKMVRVQYNKPVPHKIAAHRGGDGTAPTPPIILREGLNHVPAATWEEAKKLPVVRHHLAAKVVPVERDGKRVVVPLIEELGDAPAPAEKKKPGGDADKAEAEAAAKERAEAEALAKRNQQQGGGQQGRSGR